MNKRSCIAVVILFFASAINLLGAQYSAEAKDFTHFGAQQQSPVWCWAAVIQMLMNYHAVPVSQPEIVASVKGRVVDAAATNEEIAKALSGWKTTARGVSYTTQIELYFSGAAPASVLFRMLSRQQPIILGLKHHHVVIGWKATFTGSDAPLAANVPAEARAADPKLALESIDIFDPWDATIRTIRIGTPEFADITDTWFPAIVRAENKVF